MNDTWDSADIDQAIAELKANGWMPKTPTIWRSPAGKLHAGPAGAWKTMKREQNDARLTDAARLTGAPSLEELAEAIAKRLFTNGFGDQATHLELKDSNRVRPKAGCTGAHHPITTRHSIGAGVGA